jgi:hypothetical protein
MLKGEGQKVKGKRVVKQRGSGRVTVLQLSFSDPK